MRKIALLFYVFLMVGLSARGQEDPITEFDLYGHWVSELEVDGQVPEKLVYKQMAESNISSSERWTEISLLAFEKCEFNSSSQLRFGMCGNEPTLPDKHSWSYNQENQIITITTLNTEMKNFSEKDPEEYSEFGSPELIKRTEIRVIRLPNDTIGLEKTTHNTGYSK